MGTLVDLSENTPGPASFRPAELQRLQEVINDLADRIVHVGVEESLSMAAPHARMTAMMTMRSVKRVYENGVAKMKTLYDKIRNRLKKWNPMDNRDLPAEPPHYKSAEKVVEEADQDLINLFAKETPDPDDLADAFNYYIKSVENLGKTAEDIETEWIFNAVEASTLLRPIAVVKPMKHASMLQDGIAHSNGVQQVIRQGRILEDAPLVPVGQLVDVGENALPVQAVKPFNAAAATEGVQQLIEQGRAFEELIERVDDISPIVREVEKKSKLIQEVEKKSLLSDNFKAQLKIAGSAAVGAAGSYGASEGIKAAVAGTVVGLQKIATEGNPASGSSAAALQWQQPNSTTTSTTTASTATSASTTTAAPEVLYEEEPIDYEEGEYDELYVDRGRGRHKRVVDTSDKLTQDYLEMYVDFGFDNNAAVVADDHDANNMQKSERANPSRSFDDPTPPPVRTIVAPTPTIEEFQKAMTLVAEATEIEKAMIKMAKLTSILREENLSQFLDKSVNNFVPSVDFVQPHSNGGTKMLASCNYCFLFAFCFASLLLCF
jgi:hypothetical protein